MPEKEQEKLPQRYPFIAVVGPVGIGKTKFTELAVEETGITQFQEPYPENPYLEDFYNDPDKNSNSFNSQMFFLANKGLQIKKINELARTEPVIQDPGKEVDLIIANVQWKMGWMTDDEHMAYMSTYSEVYKNALKPDVYVALEASENTVIERIVKRGRAMELTMLEKCPDYFPALLWEFNRWLKEKLEEDKSWVTVIDTDKFDFARDSSLEEEIAIEAKNWIDYYLTNANQRNYIGSDGAKLIIPGSLRIIPHYVDYVPPPEK